jgi:hypothetical protein
LKHCKGGTQVYKALWMFNQLVVAPNMAVLNSKRTRGYTQMADKDKQYLGSVLDIEQYPAARCAMGKEVKMYGRSASSGVEAMNAVNMGIHERCCVCLVNATILLLKMEADRFARMKESAWAHEGVVLTPHGRQLADEIYKEVPNHCDYTIQKAEYELYDEFKVRGNHMVSQNQMVKVMKEVYRGHWATSCTCGVPQMMCVPCRYIDAVAKSGKSEGLNLVTAMPYFWSTRWWRTQFPQEEAIRCNIDVEYLKETHEPDNSIRYCPDAVGVRKKGRPKKKGSRKKSPLEEALAKSRGEKNVRKRHVTSEAELMESDLVEDELQLSELFNRNKGSLKMYDEVIDIMNMYIRSPDFDRVSPLLKRKQFLNSIDHNFNTSVMKPTYGSIRLYDGTLATVPVYDMKKP